jgi:hypothetical protein
MLRHKVRAGMTGWAQVHGWRRDTSMRMRIKHDLYYIENWSLLLDQILALTVVHGLRHQCGCTDYQRTGIRSGTRTRWHTMLTAPTVMSALFATICSTSYWLGVRPRT